MMIDGNNNYCEMCTAERTIKKSHYFEYKNVIGA